MKEFQDLVDTMKRLRAPDGCPWDREQTLETLKPYLLEETYETIEAMDIGGEELKGELGDILLNIVFQSLIMEEENQFRIEDVCNKVNEKLIRRHPHVFGEVRLEDSGEVLRNWDEIKSLEKEHRHRVSVLDGIPKNFPPLLKAQKIQKKASKVGFDWDNIDGAFEKIEEEIAELKEAYEKKDERNIEEELGDLFFSIVNISRFLKVDSSEALRKTNVKFERRFRYVEENCDLKNSSLEEMEKLWEEAKKLEKK